MPVTITHSTPADGTFSATGAAAWDATHTVSGLGTMAEQNSNNVNITGGSITGVTGVLTGLTVGTTATSGGAAGQIMFDTGSVLQESSALTFASNTLQINGANILGGTNSFTLGGAAAASPSAQTLRAQSVVAGTSNTAGANLTITGSQGTGTGAGGSIIFQVAPAGSSGTAQNALTNALTVSPTSTANSFYIGVGSPSTALLSNFGNVGILGAFNSSASFGFESSVSYSSTSGAIAGLFANTGTAITSGSRMGGIWFGAASSASALRNSTIIAGFATQNWVDASAYGSRLEFGTTANNSTTRTTRLIIGNSGIITFGATEANTVPALKPSSTALQVRLGDDSAYAQLDALTYTLSTDVILSRRGAANLRLGAADAAAPVAQTLSVQSVVAGTSNTAGANLTITGSQGTGTGAGGSIIFQVAPAGSSGTAQNALTTALSLVTNSSGASYAAVGAPSSAFLTTNAATANQFSLFVSSATSTLGVGIESRAAYSLTGGGTVGLVANTGSAITSGNRLGGFLFGAASSASAIRNTAIVHAFATENWVDASAYGTRLEFGTTANTTTTRTTRLIIGNSGIITFGATEANTVPALKPSSAILQARLADDSGYTTMDAQHRLQGTAPASATATGTAGDIRYDADYIYICTATNTWKRVAIATWP